MRDGSDHKLMTATQISIALGISHARFFSFHPVPVRRVQRSYGHVLGFAIATLPDALLALFPFQQRRSASFRTDFVSEEIQKRRRIAIGDWLERRRAPVLGPRTVGLCVVLNRYLRHLDNGMPEVQANVRARAHYLRIFRRDSINERQIRRRAARVIDGGGPELAPIDAYDADGAKSMSRKHGKQEASIDG